MSFSVLISSVNYNGRVGTITFTPTTGGTISLGSQTIPYTYVSANPYGSYSIYFPLYNNTCNLTLTPPSYTITLQGKGKGCSSATGLGKIGRYRINGGVWTSLNVLNSQNTSYITLSTLTVPYGTIIDVYFPSCYYGIGYIPTAGGAGDYDSLYGYSYYTITATNSKTYYFNLNTITV